MKKIFSAALILTLTLACAAPALAANKEHQQLMADLRILQEQAQLLQNALDAINESMKTMDGRVTQRVDQLSAVLVKAFADQKLSLDNLSNDVRVIREKLDDNNVRIGSLTQEVSALRQGPTPTRVRVLHELFGVGERTLRRWRQWWQKSFAEGSFWRAAQGRFMPALTAGEFPGAMAARFGAHVIDGLCRLLRFLSPITTGSCTLSGGGF